MSVYDPVIAKINELTAEIAKLRAERENLLDLLKAAREHEKRCAHDMLPLDGVPRDPVMRDDGDLLLPLERCKEIETP